MTKEERIKALYEEYEKKSQEAAGEKIKISNEDFNKDEWKSLRIECAESKDVSKAFSWLVTSFADYASDIFNGSGVFDIAFVMRKSSEFDNSDEAKQLRAELKQKQKDIANEFKEAVIRLQEEPDEETEVH